MQIYKTEISLACENGDATARAMYSSTYSFAVVHTSSQRGFCCDLVLWMPPSARILDQDWFAEARCSRRPQLPLLAPRGTDGLVTKSAATSASGHGEHPVGPAPGWVRGESMPEAFGSELSEVGDDR